MSGNQQDEKNIARKLRAAGLASGTDPRQIAAAIHAECAAAYSTSLLKAHRLARGVSLDDVVAQIRALYRAEGQEPRGLTTSLLSCYESGRKLPGAEYVHYLCEVYGVGPVELGYDRPCVCGDGHTGVREGGEPVGAGAIHVPAGSGRRGAAPPAHAGIRDGAEEEDDDMLRQTMLQLLGGAGVALDGAVLGTVDRVRSRVDDTLVASTVTPTMLDEWEQTAAGYGRRYMTVPPMWLLLETMLDFSEVRRHAERRQPLELAERLNRVTAQLSGLAGILMIDLGDHRMSRSFFRTARLAAEETGDRGLRAWVVAREALVPLYHGDPASAIELARRSEGLAGSTGCAASAMAPAQEARAQARLARLGRGGATQEAERALDRAESALARLPAIEQADTAFGYTERQLRFHQGNVLTHLSDSARAFEAQREALRQYPASVTLDRTLVAFDQAACHLEDGEVEEGLRQGHRVLAGTPAGHRTGIVLNRARELSEAVPPSCADLQAFRDFQEELALAATSSGEAPARSDMPSTAA